MNSIRYKNFEEHFSTFVEKVPEIGNAEQADRALERINTHMHKLRVSNKSNHTNAPVLADVDVRIGYLHGKLVKRLIATLRPTGCHWVREGNGCFMCAHDRGAKHDTYTEKDKKELFASIKDMCESEKYKDVPIFCIYNGGSALSDDELPNDVLLEMCTILAKTESIKMVVFESRVEFVTYDLISKIKKILRDDQILKIACGMESSNDSVRKYCVNKGLTLNDYTEAFNIMDSCKCDYRIYLLLKPILLTEFEAVTDVLNSLSYIQHNCNPSEVHLEPMTIQEGSLSSLLFNLGLYQLPSLWSIGYIISNMEYQRRIYVSPFKHFPRSRLVPSNCEDCSKRITKLILEDYDVTGDTSKLRAEYCNCLERWGEDTLALGKLTLSERLVSLADILDKKD